MPGKPTKSTASPNGSQALKSGWRRVQFEQMAENIGDRDPREHEFSVHRQWGQTIAWFVLLHVPTQLCVESDGAF
jgi:predicted ABC-type ATPase